MLAVTGSIIGILLGIIICVLQIKFKLIRLEGNSFLINYFPVKLVLTDILLVIATVFLIAFIAAWLPAKKAAQQTFELKN